ncbi:MULTISPECIES: hypothetical protein [Deefgea]|uniref:Uncharacterized protein n=1 Tax=Deefgea chitinilytica TaxID=570276 RepID=A0ABS2CC90_9NEIS|nr:MULTISPECIES: hypothetical protein [Deefgea]MBM5571769.1 hypothetical protein [Deefgea chitinilytica]MBM9889004.1 hypothetical protein [Deefgea sp. CFH1-16]
MKNKKIVLLLTQAHLAALAWSERGALPLKHFAHDEAGRADLAEFVLRYPAARYYLLTDLVEEDFQRDVAPHLSSRDQSQLLRRKLDQLFRATPYRRAVVQTRGKRGQQDQLQLSAIINRELLDVIVEVLLTARVDLQGIYSVALLSQDIFYKLKLDIPHLLLMSSSCAGTLRQSYFTPAGLQFSRLGAFDAKQQLSGQGLLIAAEIRRARQYLSTLRLMGRDEQLQVLALFDASFAEQLPLVIHELSEEAEQLEVVAESGLPMLVQKLKLPAQCSTWHDVLVASLLNLKVSNHYAPPKILRYGRLYQIGRGMQWAALSIFVLGLILSGFGFWQSDQIQQQLNLNNTQIQREHTRLRELNQKLKSANAEQPAQIQAAVELYRRDIQHWPSAEHAAQQFSQIFLAFPRLMLEKFEWHVGGMTPAVAEGQPVSGEPTLPRGAEQWMIAGRVSDPAAYRQALSDVNRLAERLRQLPNATVNILKQPIDIRPEASVNTKVAGPDGKARVDFIIQVTLAATTAELAP